MELDATVLDSLRVTPGKAARLSGRDPAGSPLTDGGHGGHGAGKHGKKERRRVADAGLEAFTADLSAAQELLYASATVSLLVVFQGLDAAGKDGTIKHVLSGVNPQGCQVVSFKQPSTEELAHDYLWRVSRALPERGRIGVFNRSHYEDVLVVRVHPELLGAQHLGVAPTARGPEAGRRGAGGPPTGEKALAALWQQRYSDINAFERHLDRNGTRIVKFFVNVSKEEQRSRLLARLDDPSKHWKFSGSDLPEHQLYDRYQVAYEEALTATSTPWAPWYVIPADHKHVLRALVAGVLAHTLASLDLELPAVDADTERAIAAARATLAAEGTRAAAH